MKQSTKALLLSALVFPGLGQLSINKKNKGWSIIVLVIIILSLIIGEVVKKAQLVVEEMQKSGAVMDSESISAAVASVSSFSDNIYLNILLILFVTLWAFAAFDAYRMK